MPAGAGNEFSPENGAMQQYKTLSNSWSNPMRPASLHLTRPHGTPMRAFAVCIAALLLSSAAYSSDWTTVATTKEGVAHEIDRASIKPYGKWVKAWQRASGQHDLSNGTGKPFKSTLLLSVIDCEGERIAVLHAAMYSDSNWTKQIGMEDSDEYNLRWSYITPDSLAEFIERFVCAQPSK
jgi:hypothetical protein